MLTLNDAKTEQTVTATDTKTTAKEKFGAKTTAFQVLQNVDLTGKTFLITGTTAGIGGETARVLAIHGAHVVMANRNVELSEALRENIYKKTENRNIDILELDLSSLKSVKEAAEKFLSRNWSLDVLILNAGVYNPTNKTTVDGYEATFGINYLGHFYLTKLLLEKLRQSASSRVVVVSSFLNRKTGNSKNFEDRLTKLISQDNTNESALKLYNFSKLCTVLMAEKLHCLENENQVSVYILNPGFIPGTQILNSKSKLQSFIRFVTKPFSKTIEQGAATTVYCATAPNLESGKYFENCTNSKKDMSKSLAHNQTLQDALWEKTLELIRKHEDGSPTEEQNVQTQELITENGQPPALPVNPIPDEENKEPQQQQQVNEAY